jgi:tetratricopeptide (TPR) repeat protein
MWRQSAEITQDAALKQQRNENSAREYATATSLSPNNAGLWNEWGSLNLYSFGDLDAAQEKLDRSLALDQRFDQTYLLRAAVHLQRAAQLEQERNNANGALSTTPVTDTAKTAELKETASKADAAWREELNEARAELQQALVVNPNSQQALQELTRIGIQLGDLQSAISATQSILDQNPNDWTSLKNLAVLYSDTKRLDRALDAAQRALALAPPDQQAALQVFVQQLSAPK